MLHVTDSCIAQTPCMLETVSRTISRLQTILKPAFCLSSLLFQQSTITNQYRLSHLKNSFGRHICQLSVFVNNARQFPITPHTNLLIYYRVAHESLSPGQLFIQSSLKAEDALWTILPMSQLSWYVIHVELIWRRVSD